jgi:reactive chlorine resistance protein C
MIINVIQRRAVARPTGVSGHSVEVVGRTMLRYGLVFMLLSGGLAKFTADEAQFIQPLVASSPLMAWLYGVTSVQGASNLIGVTELVLALLIAVHRWKPRLAAIGGALCAVEFLTMLSFLFTTPGLPPAMAGFLFKDIMLLGVAVWATGESLRVAMEL